MNINSIFSIDFSDIDPDQMSEEIMNEVADDLEEIITDIYTDLTAPPPDGTPVGTGAARNSWQVDNTVRLAPEVFTTSPYMGRLNDGHSKQSPSGFIDAIVDRHTRD